MSQYFNNMKGTCFLFLLVLVVFPIDKVKGDGDELRLFFEPMERQTVLWKCASNMEGMKFRIPKLPDCKIDQDMSNSTQVNATLYWPDVSISTLEARECWVQEQELEWEKYFWSGHVAKSKGPIRQSRITEDECRFMIHNDKTFRGTQLSFISKNLRGTNDPTVPDPSRWGSVDVVTVRNYYIATITMTVSNEDRSIIPVGATLLKECLVDESSCPTSRGILVWNGESHQKCRVMIANKTSCVKSGNRVSCEEINRSMVGFRIKKMCNTEVLVSEQGVLFTTDIDNEIIPGVSSTKTVVNFINLMNSPKTSKKSRRKRSSQYGPSHNVAFVSNSEMGSAIQHAIYKITDATNSEIRNMHAIACNNNMMTVSMALHHLSRGDATLMVRTMTSDPSLRATREGDVLNVWKCDAITRWYARDRNDDEKSINEWPIVYFYGDKRYEAFLKPGGSHELVDYPTQSELGGTNFYLETEESKLYLMNNRSIISNINYMVNPGDPGKVGQIPQITFANKGVHYLEEITGRGKLTAMLQSLGSYSTIDRGIARLESGEKPKGKEESALDSLFSWGLQDVFKHIYYLCLGLGVVVVAVVAIVLAMYWTPVVNAIKAVYDFCSALITCFLKGVASVFSFFTEKIQKYGSLAKPDEETLEQAADTAGETNDAAINVDERNSATVLNETTGRRGRALTPITRRRHNITELPLDILRSRIYPDMSSASAPQKEEVYNEAF